MSGRFASGARVSTQIGVDAATYARSTAIERRGVSTTPCDPMPPSRSPNWKNTTDELWSTISSKRPGFASNHARMCGIVPFWISPISFRSLPGAL